MSINFCHSLVPYFLIKSIRNWYSSSEIFLRCLYSSRALNIARSFLNSASLRSRIFAFACCLATSTASFWTSSMFLPISLPASRPVLMPSLIPLAPADNPSSSAIYHHFFSLCHISAMGVELISLQPIQTQANIINKKKANKTAKIMTAKTATNKANILSMVVNI